jgi:hypothetical protein
MVLGKINAFYSENRTELINTLCWQNAKPVNVKLPAYIFITALQKVKVDILAVNIY